jgi:predicted transcriptional regulator
MAGASGRPEEDFSVRVPGDLKAAFETAAKIAERPAAQVIVDFMRDYVEEHQRPDPNYDEWFRAQIQAAIDDPRANVSHDEVVRRTRAIIDQAVIDQAVREG